LRFNFEIQWLILICFAFKPNKIFTYKYVVTYVIKGGDFRKTIKIKKNTHTYSSHSHTPQKNPKPIKPNLSAAHKKKRKKKKDYHYAHPPLSWSVNTTNIINSLHYT
jgi:hypothetical protein